MADDYVCNCFFTNNYFLHRQKLHVRYLNRAQFIEDYNAILKETGCSDEHALEGVINELEEEFQRRKSYWEKSNERIAVIRNNYVPLHPELYCLEESYFTEEFINLINYMDNYDTQTSISSDLLQKIEISKGDRIFAFSIFTKEFCKKLIEELRNFENSSLPKGRPNTMNKHGILLYELGFEESFLIPLRKKYLLPLTKALYSDWGGEFLDSHRAFIVTYGDSGDQELTLHYDNSEVTLNICLGFDFTGGELYFAEMYGEKETKRNFLHYRHEPGVALLHRGRQMHGAMPTEDGTRYNMVIWMRSSKIRNKLCPRCFQKPDLIHVENQGDGFTKDACTVI